jgi:hypothetical protein
VSTHSYALPTGVASATVRGSAQLSPVGEPVVKERMPSPR